MKEAPKYINIANFYFDEAENNVNGDPNMSLDTVVYFGHKDCDAETEYVRSDLVPQWHKVEDCLPERGHHVLCTDGIGYGVGFVLKEGINRYRWVTPECGFVSHTVVAWMEIPTFNEE